MVGTTRPLPLLRMDLGEDTKPFLVDAVSVDEEEMAAARIFRSIENSAAPQSTASESFTRGRLTVARSTAENCFTTGGTVTGNWKPVC